MKILNSLELKSLKIGDEVFISYKDMNSDDKFNYEKSEVVLIDNGTIYFNNDFGTWDIDLNSNGYVNTGDYIFSVYK
jgi:hypothetical protein